MAVTDTKKYTVQEKLNKMDVDLITIICAAKRSSGADELMIEVTEIPNAVSVPGGSSILQSMFLHNEHASQFPAGVYFISDSSRTFLAEDLGGDDAADAIGESISGEDMGGSTILTGLQASFTVASSSFDQIGSADSYAMIDTGGVPVKAASGSTSLYLWAMTTSSTVPSTDQNVNIKLGFVKD